MSRLKYESGDESGFWRLVWNDSIWGKITSIAPRNLSHSGGFWRVNDELKF